MSKERDKTQHFDDDGIILNAGVLVFDLMMLNVMWFLCSLPVVTIGASTTALNYTCLKIQRDEGDSVVGMFFHSLKDNFRQSLFMGTGMVAALIILFAGLIQCLGSAAAGHSIAVFLAIGCVILLFGWILLFSYLFMVQARFENTILRTFTNAIYFAIRNPGPTLKIFAIDLMALIGVPYFLWNYLPFLFPMILFFGMPLATYLKARIFNPLFESYIKK